MKIINALLSSSVLLVFSLSQVLAAPPGPPGGHLNIVEVLVDDPNNPASIMISGENFSFGPGPLVVTLGNATLTVIEILDVTPTDTYIEASLPVDLPAGDYLLTISMGNGQSENDEYDLTIGALSPVVLPTNCADGSGLRWSMLEARWKCEAEFAICPCTELYAAATNEWELLSGDLLPPNADSCTSIIPNILQSPFLWQTYDPSPGADAQIRLQLGVTALEPNALDRLACFTIIDDTSDPTSEPINTLSPEITMAEADACFAHLVSQCP